MPFALLRKTEPKALPQPARATLEAPPIVDETIHSPSQPLDAATRTFFEPRLGYDLSRVRIHVDAQAAESAAAVGAMAYTVGSHIIYGKQGFQPSTNAGRHLLAHELTHVIQQTAAGRQSLLQRQPNPAPALDPDDQKVVDAAQRESGNFKCNVGPVLWGILKKHFPDDVRKVAGVGCETALPGLRAEFSTTDPKNPKAVRSVPMIYAGKAFIASTNAANLKDRIADIGNQIEAIDDWRLANFLIDAQDLSNPKVTGQLRSMSAGQLIDYKNKSKDDEVKRYTESLITISTPIQPGSGVDPLSGNMAMVVNGVNVVIQPDIRGAAKVTGGDTTASFELNPNDIPRYNTDAKGIVNGFPGYTPTGTLTIVTRYQAGVKPEGVSGYGRGTTKEDIANKATAMRFHEGSHGEDFIEFVRTHPLPAFAGKNGDKAADFQKARKDFLDALSAWTTQLNAVKNQTDCVGKTIDEFHKGQPGWKKVC